VEAGSGSRQDDPFYAQFGCSIESKASWMSLKQTRDVLPDHVNANMRESCNELLPEVFSKVLVVVKGMRDEGAGE
jgi:hypothetical protein